MEITDEIRKDQILNEPSLYYWYEAMSKKMTLEKFIYVYERKIDAIIQALRGV